MKNVPSRFSKDEAISYLRGCADQEVAKNLEKGLPESVLSKKLYDAIKSIRELPGEYIDFRLFPDESELPYEIQLHMRANITEYVSSADVMKANHQRTEVMSQLKVISGLKPEYEPSYAFKIGPDNAHEILAGKLLDPLDLEEFVLKKSEATFQHLNLEGAVSPSGIRKPMG